MIQLAADFARSIDARSGYQVFLTPGGDNRGLFVANKTAAGFEVREAQGGRASISFDYRVIGHPAGVSQARLPEMRSATASRAALGHVPQ